MSSQYSIVHLKVKAETEFGQVVHVSGSSFTMGNFSTAEVRSGWVGGLLTFGFDVCSCLCSVVEALRSEHCACMWHRTEG